MYNSIHGFLQSTSIRYSPHSPPRFFSLYILSNGIRLIRTPSRAPIRGPSSIEVIYVWHWQPRGDLCALSARISAAKPASTQMRLRRYSRASIYRHALSSQFKFNYLRRCHCAYRCQHQSRRAQLPSAQKVFCTIAGCNGCQINRKGCL